MFPFLHSSDLMQTEKSWQRGVPTAAQHVQIKNCFKCFHFFFYYTHTKLMRFFLSSLPPPHPFFFLFLFDFSFFLIFLFLFKEHVVKDLVFKHVLHRTVYEIH